MNPRAAGGHPRGGGAGPGAVALSAVVAWGRVSLDGDVWSPNVLSLERRGGGGLCGLEHVGVAAEEWDVELLTRGVSAVSYRPRGGNVCVERDGWLD